MSNGQTETTPAGGMNWRTPLLVIVAGCLIAMTGFGIRSVFGLFMEPMLADKGWSRETFSLALALQNLLWGIGVPIAGILADKYGPSRVLALGAVVYAIGVYGMAESQTSGMLHVTAGLLTGTGVAFTAFSLALAAMAKVVGPERRTMALGLGTAAGSAGQVVFSPITQQFIQAYGWHDTLFLLSAAALFIIPLAFVLPHTKTAKGEVATDQTIRQALSEAVSHRGYVLLTIGFFVCGFHVAFITVHFPSYVQDIGLAPLVGAIALSLVGFCNIAGSFMSGIIGQRFSKKGTLSVIYLLRAIAITGLMLAPKTEFTIYAFAIAMGFLWLSTVPLTTGIVAQVFGLKYMATLFGVVFFSHQLGSFAGVYLGGYLYDTTGTYDAVWWAGVGFGLLAAIIHVPINEKPLARLRPAG
jgi:predicted MFS family arabinose efflux permease